MIRILHAADLHLDSPFEGLPAEKTAIRRREQRELLRTLPRLRSESGAQLVLLAGDVFDRGVAFAETEEALASAIAECAVPVVISPGNHDYYALGGRWDRMRLPENAYIFKRAELDFIDLPELDARVYGALGHIHAYSGARTAGRVPCAWPGCPEGRGYDECGEKGMIIADIGGGTPKITFVPTCLRRYETLTFDLGAGAAVELPPDAERNCYKIVLTGEVESPPDIAALRRSLEGQCFALRLRDETRLRRDVWERAGEDTLRGNFLRILKERLESAENDAQRELIDRAARWGLAALERREEAEEL